MSYCFYSFYRKSNRFSRIKKLLRACPKLSADRIVGIAVVIMLPVAIFGFRQPASSMACAEVEMAPPQHAAPPSDKAGLPAPAGQPARVWL